MEASAHHEGDRRPRHRKVAHARTHAAPPSQQRGAQSRGVTHALVCISISLSPSRLTIAREISSSSRFSLLTLQRLHGLVGRG